jgi:uncharacterized membrane protein
MTMLLDGSRRDFLAGLDTRAIEAAIRRAETGTTGEIRGTVLPRYRGSIETMAERSAASLGMTATRDRNGVLILVDPSRRLFRVWGDRGIHEKAGDDFWRAVAGAIQELFRRGDFTGGLVHGVEAAGRELARHFPAGPGGHVDQQPESVEP